MKYRTLPNLLAIATVVGVLVLAKGVHADHRWLGLWSVVVFVVFGLLPVPVGGDASVNAFSVAAGRPIGPTARFRSTIRVSAVPRARARRLRIAFGFALVLIALLLA